MKKRFINKLTRVLVYLEREWGDKAAKNFLVIVDSKINALQNHPYIGSLTHINNVRGIHITKHNRLFYRVDGNTIAILNLFDTRRKNYRT